MREPRPEFQEKRTAPSIEVSGELRRHLEEYIRIAQQRPLNDFWVKDFMLSPERKSIRKVRIERGIADEMEKVMPEDVIELLSSLLQKMAEGGFVDRSQLISRWLKADPNSEHMESILESITSRGGKRQDSEVGVAMSDDGQSDEMCANNIMAGKNGVLLLYDKSKLARMSAEEIAASRFGVYMRRYGYKPAEGESFKSALVGYVVFK